MAPAGLPVVAVLVALWATVATRHRSSFAPLLAQRPAPASHTVTRPINAALLGSA
jgi:hypothetical protein